jgi:gliding motility-associated-like protein
MSINSCANNAIGIRKLDTICVGESICYLVQNAECPYNQGHGFSWIFKNAVQDSLIGDTVTASFSDTGVFELILFASKTFSFDSGHTTWNPIVVLPCPPEVSFEADKRELCQSNYVQYKDYSRRFAKEWQWVFEGGTPAIYYGQFPPPIYYNDTGSFAVSLTATSKYGSSTRTDSNYIHVSAGPTPHATIQEFQIKEGDEITLDACARAAVYTWHPVVSVLNKSDTLLIIQPEQSQDYTAEVATSNGCKTICAYTVKVQSGLLLPTAFSPNQDGINDNFRILNTNIDLQNFQVYNRWGEKVFETDAIEDGWDGVYKGVKQPLGVYIWKCNYTLSKTHKTKSACGNVNLIR